MMRFYRLLAWFGWHVLRPLGLNDRWGFNLGEDLEEWSTMRRFVHLDRINKTSGFEPVDMVVPIGWRCEHFSITGTGLAGKVTTTLCNCNMRPIFH